MLSKKDKSKIFLEENINLLTCPVCGESLSVDDDYTLKCINGHSFDISKKGVVNLYGQGNHKIYDDKLFASRRKVITGGFYSPLVDTMSNIIHNHLEARPSLEKNSECKGFCLDAGCGEGSFLNEIRKLYSFNCEEITDVNSVANSDASIEVKSDMNSEVNSNFANMEMSYVGVDLSKQGVDLASDYNENMLWLVDDIANIHLASGTFDVILNILSPANYSEFKRLLTDDGVLIKVIPGDEYLKELRALTKTSGDSNTNNNLDINYDPDANNNLDYNNGTDKNDSLSYANKEMNVFDTHRVKYELELNYEEFKSFAEMTPLTHGKSIDLQAVVPTSKNAEDFFKLTIDLIIITGVPI